MSDQSYKVVGGRVITSRLSQKQSWTGAVTVLVICIGLFIFLTSLGFKYVRGVREAVPSDDSNVTYEEAYAKFYNHPKWEFAKSGDQKIVRFSGECRYQDTDVQVVLDFWIEGDRFYLNDGTINGEPADSTTLSYMVSEPFKTYKK